MIRRLIISIPILILVLLILSTIIMYQSKPDEEILINILVDNGVELTGTQTNMRTTYTDELIDTVYIHIAEKEQIKDIQILDSGYDFINKKYFALVYIFALPGHGRLDAKLTLFLNYDKGWKLADDMGVVDAFYREYDWE